MSIENIFLYRITHIKNISHILEHGITHRNSANANPTFKSIGDESLIATRNKRQVIIDNGQLYGEKSSVITLGDFIPFYFGIRMPMLYVIQNGGNFVKNKTSAEHIVYIVCSLQAIIDRKLHFYFSDGHATDRMTSFYSADYSNQIPKLISWKAVKSRYWGGNDNLNMKRKKQAELLVREDVPIDCIRGYVVYNESAKNKMIDLKIEEKTIKIVPRAYY